MAERLYVVQRSFYPAGAHVDAWVSNVYPNLSAAQQGARMYLNGATDDAESALPCTFTDGSKSHEVSIHPLRLPQYLQSDHGDIGWVVALTSWPNHIEALRCPVEWDVVSRFTYENACEHAAVLAYRSCDLVARMECQLLVLHDETDMPHWFGEKEVETHFTIRVFERIFYSRDAGSYGGSRGD
jgi:hypothetical protein